MGKTDGTDPYEVQARDLGLHGYIRHRHIMVQEICELMPVTWQDLVDYMARWGFGEQVVRAALANRFYAGAGSTLTKHQVDAARRLIYVSMPWRVKLAIKDSQHIPPDTVVGQWYRWRDIPHKLPCDYHPQNGLVNRRLRQSYNGQVLRGTLLARRCTREVLHYGGCHSEERHFRARRSTMRPNKAERQLATRRARRNATLALHRMKIEQTDTAYDVHLPGMAKRRYW